MKKIFLFTILLLCFSLYYFWNTSDDSLNFSSFSQVEGYKAQPPRPVNVKKIPKSIVKNKMISKTSKSRDVTLESETISNEQAIKSCNLILKSKLSMFKKFDAFLSSPCREVASEKISLDTSQDKNSLNWIQFYQSVNIGLKRLSFNEKEQLKSKIVVQLSNPGNLIQARILGDILITIMNKHDARRAQEIEKLNTEMATEVDYITNASGRLNKNDPLHLELVKQEIQAVQRFRREFRNIMDIK